MTDEFVVAKESGTYADIFTAAGLADLFASSVGAEHVRIREEPTAFHVLVDSAEPLLESVLQDPGYPFLQAKAEAIPSGLTRVVRYPEERQRVAAFNEARRAARSPGGQVPDPALVELQQRNQPRPDWRLLQVLNVLQGFKNTNKVHEMIVTMPAQAFHDQVVRGLDALVRSQPSGLDWKTSSVQLFNPNAAKGYGLLKPSGTDRNNKTKEQWTDSFVEWLRYRGYFVTACPCFIGSRGEHIRVFAPVPADISLVALRNVADELRQAPLYGAAPKLDALATLRLTRLLIERSEFGESSGPLVALGRIRLTHRTPARVVSGLAITHFQSLGQARAVSQLATLALPDWFPIESQDDANAWLLILEEHRRVVASLRDDHSNEIGLLIAYRSFLERRGKAAVDTLMDFMGAYGAQLPAARDRGRRLPAFSADNLHRIVEGMMGDYVAILDDTGFRAVAAAIRRSTVNAQALKANKQDYREIRYELLHDIRRKRSLPNGAALLEALADFIASYNYENARRREMGKRAPANVTTDEFEGLTRLLEAYGASLVGAMLAAYGSCRVARAADAAADPTDDTAPDEPIGDVSDASAEEEED